MCTHRICHLSIPPFSLYNRLELTHKYQNSSAASGLPRSITRCKTSAGQHEPQRRLTTMLRNRFFPRWKPNIKTHKYSSVSGKLDYSKLTLTARINLRWVFLGAIKHQRHRCHNNHTQHHHHRLIIVAGIV